VKPEEYEHRDDLAQDLRLISLKMNSAESQVGRDAS
jgi:hypothetical protein